MTYGHLQADCLYTGISSGPNARCRVWEAFTFTFLWVITEFVVALPLERGVLMERVINIRVMQYDRSGFGKYTVQKLATS